MREKPTIHAGLRAIARHNKTRSINSSSRASHHRCETQNFSPRDTLNIVATHRASSRARKKFIVHRRTFRSRNDDRAHGSSITIASPTRLTQSLNRSCACIRAGNRVNGSSRLKNRASVSKPPSDPEFATRGETGRFASFSPPDRVPNDPSSPFCENAMHRCNTPHLRERRRCATDDRSQRDRRSLTTMSDAQNEKGRWLPTGPSHRSIDRKVYACDG